MTAYVMGAVAYDPKVVSIWQGFRRWLRANGLEFEFVLYPHYELQVEDLVSGAIDAAWNSPLAHLRAGRLARRQDRHTAALVMRDTDQDLTSVVLVAADSPYRSLGDLAGATVATGAVDSPQATILPLDLFAAEGVGVEVRRFDVGVGLHGDHIGGERDAARALAAGEVAAACVLDSNHLAFAGDGTLAPGSTRVLARTERFDHCAMTVVGHTGSDPKPFADLLLSMDYGDPEVRPLLDMEGLTRWVEGRETGYQPLERAVARSGFYGPDGSIAASDYRP